MSTCTSPRLYQADIPQRFLKLLQCPISGATLHCQDAKVVPTGGAECFSISPSGIPLFAERFLSTEGRIQQQHYDAVAKAYLTNLGYPHTQEYLRYLDGALLETVSRAELGCTAEICCGRGEAFHLLQDRVGLGVGVDVSLQMLEAARSTFERDRFFFVQGDATMLPLATGAFDTVLMFGGIHHVNDRHKLFSEVFRILKPGGFFLWREPVSDFFLWRWLRYVVYRLSPGLDFDTERPLRWRETWPVLEAVGFVPEQWRTCGFLGFCFLMNSDILIFNRAFRFIPGIRGLTRAAAWLDERTVRLPGMSRAGLQVIGCARKSALSADQGRPKDSYSG